MCQVTVNVNAHPPGDRPAGPPVTIKEGKRLIIARNAARRHPRPVCRDCGFPFKRCDAGIIRRRLCATCESHWLDGVIERLVKSVGRRSAVRVLKSLGK